MTPTLKQYLIDHHGLASDATDEDAKNLASAKILSKELSVDKYAELLQADAAQPSAAQQKLNEMLQEQSKSTATAVAEQLSPALEKLADVLKERGTPTPPAADDDVTPGDDDEPLSAAEVSKQLAEMEKKLEEKLKKQFVDSGQFLGDDGASLMSMSRSVSDDDELMIRVKSVVEGYNHTPTALTYKSHRAKLLGIDGHPMKYGEREVDVSTERTKTLSAVWLKLQCAPESLTKREMEHVHWTLHNEKFHVPDGKGTNSRLLTEDERHDVLDRHMNFYTRGYNKTLLDETSGSTGAHAVPEFFDMDMIVTPTLASENLLSFVNVVPVNRGSSAENFILGRPTIGAHTEGSALSLFTTTGFITNHDTDFFRAMGAMEIGLNYEEDAHPGLVDGIIGQYRESAALWFNEQIAAGDGTTEPTGIVNESGTADITPSNPTTGGIVLTDTMNSLFGIDKAHRTRGGDQSYRQSLIFICFDQTYKRIRSISTGVTGDTRQVFGMDVHNYELFGQPVIIVESGITAAHFIAVQAKGYRLYLRQGLRFFREEAGSTLRRANTFLIGCDLRAGGRLDEGAYASVIDAFPTS